ncbi:hypothetical protein [Streptomyces lunaelactis]|uniref:hypothetical protein n=1 Tax=Streptomyces lunaelactis TaxID=1535768 RepID=UPI001585569A|nr:hypothetical protein [Streptomyces lunaelactis]NUK20593.1 hypothetical protein [Streptomyces lunaelactis]
MSSQLAGAAGRHLTAAAEHPQGLLPIRIREDVLKQILSNDFARPAPEGLIPAQESAGQPSATDHGSTAGRRHPHAGSAGGTYASAGGDIPGARRYVITHTGFLALLSDSQRRALTGAEPDGPLSSKVAWQTYAKLAKFRLVHFLDDDGNSYPDDGDTGVGRPPRRPYLTELGRSVATSATTND